MWLQSMYDISIYTTLQVHMENLIEQTLQICSIPQENTIIYSMMMDARFHYHTRSEALLSGSGTHVPDTLKPTIHEAARLFPNDL